MEGSDVEGRGPDSPAFEVLRDEEDLERALGAGQVVIYKHSPRCWICSVSIGQVRDVAEEADGVPVYLIDVIRDRPLSLEVERRLGVRHQSPQVIVVREGNAVWDASHIGVRAGRILEALSG